MHETVLKALLENVAAGSLPVESALQTLRYFGLQDLGRIQLDHHRQYRQGFPEVIYGEGKRTADLQIAIASLQANNAPVLVTRLPPVVAATILTTLPDLTYDAESRLLHTASLPAEVLPVRVGVLAAGTADVPIAHEAAGVARIAGCQVTLLADVGVAGIHRLTAHEQLLHEADLLIVIAGMEGALPSIVGGLTHQPLIAVPTSTGYGTGLGGYAAMLTMLNSCAAGTVVVNIDNGFGAGFFAGVLGRQMARRGTVA